MAKNDSGKVDFPLRELTVLAHNFLARRGREVLENEKIKKRWKKLKSERRKRR